MEQRIRFCEVEGHRIAWGEVGDGPPLVVPAPWVGNLQVDWEGEEYRAFIERLADSHRVIRYDRPGTGLSDRVLPEQPGLDFDVAVLEALLEEIGLARVSLLGISCGGCISLGYAARNPSRVSSMVFAGCYLDGSQLAPAEVRDSLVGVIRASWGLGARMLSDIFIPGGSERERAEWAAFQRASAEPDAAATLYELVYDYDATRAVDHATAPALVLHRRGDTAVSFELGRELAASLHDARFVPLEGRRHLPWQEDTEAVIAQITAFLDEHAVGGDEQDPTPEDGRIPASRRVGEEVRGLSGPIVLPELSERELEVLRLVADGLSDREIAGRLVLSPHTVHRHVANIRTKLGQPSRAAAAAHATRLKLI